MKKTHWFALALAMVLLVPLLAMAEGELPQPASAGTSAAALQSPIVGPLLEIWSDATDNVDPAVAYNMVHDEYLVVWWNEQGPNTWDIYARRVGSDGTLRSWFAVVTGPGQKNWQPAVAYSPVQDEYLIVYTYEYTTTDYDLWARRVKWDGSEMSGEFWINQDVDLQMEPAVAYNSQDDEYLVVYTNYWGGWSGSTRDIAAQRVRASDGSLLSWANVATAAGESRSEPDVAYNEARNQYLITYDSSHPHMQIRGKVAEANLAGVSVSPEITICGAHTIHWPPAVAAGPDEYLVVYQAESYPPLTWEEGIYGRRVDHEGIPLGPASGFPIATTLADDHHYPDVAYGAGYGYLVTSVYYFAGTPSDPGDPGDVYGRYVMAGQDEATGGEFAIDDPIHRQTLPAVACAPSGDCLVVEVHNALPHPGRNYEIRGRFVTPPPSPHRVYTPLILKNYGP